MRSMYILKVILLYNLVFLSSLSWQRQSGSKHTKTSAALAAEAYESQMQGQALFNLKDSHKVYKRSGYLNCLLTFIIIILIIRGLFTNLYRSISTGKQCVKFRYMTYDSIEFYPAMFS